MDETFLNKSKPGAGATAFVVMYACSFVFMLVLFNVTQQNIKVFSFLSFFYTTILSFFLYYFFCRWMPNLWFFISLLIICGLQFVFYLYLKHNGINLPVGRRIYAVSGFRNNLFIILFFQVIRFISRKTQYAEPTVPSRTGIALDESRETTDQDFVAFICYIIFVVILMNI